jgi:GWxTD domain-containing protein
MQVFHFLVLQRFVAVRGLLPLLTMAAASYAAPPAWLDLVAPIITAAEKKAYLGLNLAERQKYEEAFWSNKAITAKEYSDRIHYIDAKFGSTKLGSGANTDQGRVYLALGPPNRITRIPSSRIFEPVEIWYYSAIPGVINTEVSLMFFQKNGMGFLKLYSPTLDTIRALLIPQASTVNMFGPNDGLNESDIRNNLRVSPAEDEIVSAAVNVASGIRYSGNDEIIGKISSPAYMLGMSMRAEVKSRFIVGHPKLDIFQARSLYGGAQVDLELEVTAQSKVDIEVLEGDLTIYQNRLNLKFPESAPLRYTHRLDLLPGAYRVIFNVDGTYFPYNVNVPDQFAMGEIRRADESDVTAEHSQTPFSFDGRQLDLNPEGKLVAVAVPQPSTVKWVIRRGISEVLWRSTSQANRVAVAELPSSLPPGVYKLEAYANDDVRITDLVVKEKSTSTPVLTELSFNANLYPTLRYAFIGHQWLLRGKLDEARRSLRASLAKGVTAEALVELARTDALAGDLDVAREGVKSVLAVQPDNFEALTVFAYIETRFQDYALAADLYRRALAVQESPAVRAALSRLKVE